jgi:SPP1 gp7 family putative phage head morphogenesis protein
MRANRDPDLNEIIQRALSGTAAFYDVLQEELLAGLGRAWNDGATPDELMQLAHKTLNRHLDPFTAFLAEAEMASWLNGAAELASELPKHSSGKPGEYEWHGMKAWLPVVSHAVKDLRSRNLITRREYDRMGSALKSRAFTTAGVANRNTLERLRDAVADAVEKGWGEHKFTEHLGDALSTSQIAPGQLGTLFRTNIASAYAAGQDQILDHPLVRDEFPYVETLPIRDSRLSELCQVVSESGIGGTSIFRTDDPVWRKFRPPRHPNCRCSVRALTVIAAARGGIEEAQRFLATGVWPAQPAHVPHPSVELPKGWIPRTYAA